MSQWTRREQWAQTDTTGESETVRKPVCYYLNYCEIDVKFSKNLHLFLQNSSFRQKFQLEDILFLILTSHFVVNTSLLCRLSMVLKRMQDILQI